MPHPTPIPSQSRVTWPYSRHGSPAVAVRASWSDTGWVPDSRVKGTTTRKIFANRLRPSTTPDSFPRSLGGCRFEGTRRAIVGTPGQPLEAYGEEGHAPPFGSEARTGLLIGRRKTDRPRIHGGMVSIPRAQKIILSQTVKHANWPNSRIMRGGLARLKAEFGGEIIMQGRPFDVMGALRKGRV